MTHSILYSDINVQYQPWAKLYFILYPSQSEHVWKYIINSSTLSWYICITTVCNHFVYLREGTVGRNHTWYKMLESTNTILVLVDWGSSTSIYFALIYICCAFVFCLHFARIWKDAQPSEKYFSKNKCACVCATVGVSVCVSVCIYILQRT